MSAIREAIDQLRSGTPGHEVKERLRQLPNGFRTLSSLNSVMSEVRCAIYDSHTPQIDDTVLEEYAASARLTVAEEISAFLNAPLREQVRIQKKTNPTWPAPAEQALQSMQLLPPSLDTFKLTNAEEEELKDFQTEALIRKNETLIDVDAAQLLAHVTTVLEQAKGTPVRLLSALLLASGRRTCEIANGRSIFTAAERPHYAYFDGQAKKRGHAKPYLIPLLVPFDVFSSALAVFRELQGDVSQMSNKQIKTRYQSTIGRALKKGALPVQCKPHDLRSVYVSLVYIAFESPFTLQRTAMAICGHARLGESLAYGNVRPSNADSLRGMCGKLLVERKRPREEDDSDALPEP